MPFGASRPERELTPPSSRQPVPVAGGAGNARQMTTRDSKATEPDHPTTSSSPRRRDTAYRSILLVTVVALLAVCIQFVAPRFPPTVRQFFPNTQHWHVSTPGITLRNPLIFHEQQSRPKPRRQPQVKGTFNTRPARSMALAEQAKRVAAEFEFGEDALNKAVKEFIREMGMGKREFGAYKTLTACR
jgi:hexokinase